MKRGKILAVVFLSILVTSSNANAEVVLTVNGIDVAKEPTEIKGGEEIIIAIEGEKEKDVNYFVTAEMGCKIEPITNIESVVKEPNDSYLFSFEEEGTALGVVNLHADDDHIYELVLFYTPETDLIIAFGIGYDALHWAPPFEEPQAIEEPLGTEATSAEPSIESQPSDPEPGKDDLGQLLLNGPLAHSVVAADVFSVVCPNTVDGYNVPAGFNFSSFGEEGSGSQGMMTLGAGQVDLSEITASCVLDPNGVYYVSNPPLLIHGLSGEEIDVVIPSGTTIVLAEDWDYGIVIYDGANVYFGEPAPDSNEPNDVQSPGDTNNPAEPVWVVGKSGNPFFNNYCGILVDRTAGTRCLLNNLYLSGHYYGILADQQLEYPISNIYALGCYNGIHSFGSNKIMNSYVSYFGEWSAEWQCYGLAYCFIPESMDSSIAFVKPDFEIYNCLADDGDDAFTVYGVPDEPNIPNFYSRDCVATNCYSGFNGWDSYVAFSIICPGLYNNYQNKNFPEMPFTDPVYETNDPFVIDPNDYRIFLDPNSQFVDNGSSLSVFPGWTTRIDGKPDKGVGDIWPHYQTTKMDMYPAANLNWDESVDILDLAEFADQWLNPDPVSADFDDDGIANFSDFAVLAGHWMSDDMAVQILDLETQVTLDPNNIYGHVGIYLEDAPLYGGVISIYLDNILIDDLLLDWDNENNWVGLESDKFSNGWHTIRIVTTDLWGSVINHKPVKVYFNNLLHKVTTSDYFHPTEDYKYSGFYDGGNTLYVQVTNQDDQVIWSNTYSGPHVNIIVPGATFGSEQFCEITITETGGATMAMGGGAAASTPTVTSKDLIKEFKQSDWPNGARMVIVLPNKDVFKVRKPAIIECAEACEARGVTWLALYHKNVTDDNLTYLYNKSGVKYIYWCGHANSHVGRNERLEIPGVQRTHTMCWKHTVRNWWPDKWEEIGVFSWTNDSQYPLPNDWDSKGFSLWDLGMHDSWNKKIVFVDGCLSAKYADMASAYGVFSLQGQGSKDQIYIGWKIKVLVSKGIMEQIVGNTTEGVRMFWERMGAGDDIYDAFYYTQTHGGLGMRRAMWGDNGMLDIGAPDTDDNILLYGNGLINQMELDP